MLRKIYGYLSDGFEKRHKDVFCQPLNARMPPNSIVLSLILLLSLLMTCV